MGPQWEATCWLYYHLGSLPHQGHSHPGPRVSPGVNLIGPWVEEGRDQKHTEEVSCPRPHLVMTRVEAGNRGALILSLHTQVQEARPCLMSGKLSHLN